MRSRRLLLFAGWLLAGTAALHAQTVVLYHTSDIHGWYSSRAATWYKEDRTRKVGGFAALSSLVKKESRPWLLLESGDMFQGNPEGNLTLGMASVRLMNAVGYAAAVPGNHDYDFGEEPVQAMAREAHFPFVGANAFRRQDSQPVDYLKPIRVIEKEGIKIGILGLLNSRMSTLVLPKYIAHLEFKDPIEAARKWIPQLRGQGVNAVVVLYHEGMVEGENRPRMEMNDWQPGEKELKEGGLALARAVPGIDIILGGHRHAGFERGWKDPVSGVLLMESGSSLTSVGRVELTFEPKSRRLKEKRAELVELWVDQTGEDPAVLEILRPIIAEVAGRMNEVIGEIDKDLIRHSEGSDGSMGNWVTDVMRAAAKSQVALQNTTGLRADIPRGKVTMRQLFQLMPFDNTLVTMELSGKQLEQVFLESLEGKSPRMQISGAVVRYRQNAALQPTQIEILIDGKPINPTGWYTVATNNYLASAGSHKALNEGRNLQDTFRNIRDLLVDAVRDKSAPLPDCCARIQRLQP